MALITRISRLFTADVHAVLDRIEEPEVVLKQAVREMADEIARAEQRLHWIDGESRQLESHRTDATAEIERLDGELDLCFEEGEESLARALVKRKLVAEQSLKQAARQLDNLSVERDALTDRLDEWRQALADTRQKADVLGDGRGEGAGPLPESAVSNDAIEVAFLKEKQRRRS